jgi:hypothetical protein
VRAALSAREKKLKTANEGLVRESKTFTLVKNGRVVVNHLPSRVRPSSDVSLARVVLVLKGSKREKLGSKETPVNVLVVQVSPAKELSADHISCKREYFETFQQDWMQRVSERNHVDAAVNQAPSSLVIGSVVLVVASH